MKTIHNIAITSLFVVFASSANADCSLNQSVDDIIDCIVVEGAGGNQSLSSELGQPFVADKQQQAESATDSSAKNPG
jgi:hypothetical protein